MHSDFQPSNLWKWCISWESKNETTERNLLFEIVKQVVVKAISQFNHKSVKKNNNAEILISLIKFGI